MGWRPLHDNLIIEPDPIEKYKGLVILPDKNTEEKISPFAKVVSFGSGCKYNYHICRRILFDRFADEPMYIKENGKKLRIIKESYIHAVIED